MNSADFIWVMNGRSLLFHYYQLLKFKQTVSKHYLSTAIFPFSELYFYVFFPTLSCHVLSQWSKDFFKHDCIQRLFEYILIKIQIKYTKLNTLFFIGILITIF